MRYQAGFRERQYTGDFRRAKMFFLVCLVTSAAILLAACTSDFQRAGYEAVKADCRLQGYIPQSLEYRDCVKVGNHKVDVADMQQRLMLMQQYQSMGAIYAPQPQQLPAPTVANPQTFCYPGAGYMYCQ